MTSRKPEGGGVLLEFKKERTRLHYVENTLCLKLWTYPRANYMMMWVPISDSAVTTRMWKLIKWFHYFRSTQQYYYSSAEILRSRNRWEEINLNVKILLKWSLKIYVGMEWVRVIADNGWFLVSSEFIQGWGFLDALNHNQVCAKDSSTELGTISQAYTNTWHDNFDRRSSMFFGIIIFSHNKTNLVGTRTRALWLQ
jgi:hypothetical protein